MLKNSFAKDTVKYRQQFVKTAELVKHVEESYWKTDRIVDAKLDKLKIALNVNDNDESEFSEPDEKDD